jgi:hypothetical protein
MGETAEAVKEELQQMGQQASSNQVPSPDDSNDHQDFWGSLGDELHAEDRGDPMPESGPEVGEETEQAPPLVGDEQTPQEGEQPPQPAQQEAQPEVEEEEEEEPSSQEFDPEQAKLAAENWQKELEKFYSEQLGEDFDSEFHQNPGQHLAKMMSIATQTAIKNMWDIYQKQIPQLEQRMVQNSQGVIEATIAKRQFYREFPALAGHEKAFDKFFSRYRQIADPKTPVMDQAKEAAQVFMMRKGIQPKAQEPKAQPQSAPPPPPVSSGASPGAPSQSSNPWAAYAEELIAQDNDF